MLACHSYAVGTQNLFNKPEMLKTKIPQSVRRRHAIANFSFVFRKKFELKSQALIHYLLKEKKRLLLLIEKNGFICRFSFRCISLKKINFNLKTCINVAVYETTPTCINHDRIQYYDTSNPSLYQSAHLV